MSSGHITPATDCDSGVFYRAEGLTLYTGDALTVLRELRDASVDCVVTSPPYWRLRDYTTTDWSGGQTRCPHLASIPATPSRGGQRCVRCGATRPDSQYGREPTPADYVETLRRLFAQVHRVLRPSGTMWVNLGDSYSTNSDGYWCAYPGQPGQPRYRPVADLPHKNLLGMPWRVALALQADGWILRNAIIWHKPNATPTSIRDRLACQYELLFLLVRQPHYYFHLDPIRARYTGDRASSRRAHRGGTKPHTARGTWPPATTAETQLRGRNPGDVWTIPTQPRATSHPAPTPLELPARCIAAGCPPGGTVLDPFSGTATTGLAARQLGRGYIGIDTNPDYHAIALHRLGVIAAEGDRTTSGEERQ
jgi:DNA modification methylase